MLGGEARSFGYGDVRQRWYYGDNGEIHIWFEDKIVRLGYLTSEKTNMEYTIK